MSGKFNLRPDIFDWQGIHIYQDEGVHKVGTDGVLLGAWVPTILTHPKIILDAGTGSGILAMMMAKSFPKARICAIDIDDNALRLANQNVISSKLEDRISVSSGNILTLSKQQDNLFDLILSNPPFYTEQILPPQEAKRRAKHICVPEHEWINGLLARLSPEGHLCIIVPYASTTKWIYAANDKGYYNQQRLDVFSFATDPFPKRSLLHFTSRLIKPSIAKLSIYTTENDYTQAYLKLTGIRTRL